MKTTLIELNLYYLMATHQSVLTLISNFFLPSKITTMQQTNSITHKLKLRSFYKSTHLQAYLTDFYPWYEPYLTYSHFLFSSGTDHNLYFISDILTKSLTTL